MSKDKNCCLNAIKLDNGQFSDSGSVALKEMFRVHFPGSKQVSGTLPATISTLNCGRSNGDIAKKIVTYDKVKWAIKSFKSYKDRWSCPGSSKRRC